MMDVLTLFPHRSDRIDSVHHPPDLSQRFRMEVWFPEPGEPEDWDAINSFSHPIEAVRGCSECLEAVKDLLGTPHGSDLEANYIRIRIRDMVKKAIVVWEGDDGGLLAAPDFLCE